jgi:deoxyribodipyrimidine photo-lyase
MTSIWWLRRDLRLADNPSLAEAMKAGSVVPAFVLDPRLLAHPAPRRQQFLFEGLHFLDSQLRQRGSSLVVRKGDPSEELRKLLVETGAETIFAEEDFTPYARQRDARIARVLPLHLISGQTVHHPSSVLNPDGRPYTVFTPYSKKWRARLGHIKLLPAPERIYTPPGIRSEPLPAFKPNARFPAGDMEAAVRLEEFMHRKIFSYDGERDRLDLDGTSALSPYIRFGMLGLRQAVGSAHQFNPSGAWLNELIWREFYIQILFHFPYVRRRAFNASLAQVAWREDASDFEAWKQGQTGVPIVDAAMRQLLRTGWMHNRARMIAASYLVKDLFINWQMGERWFMENLIDGDAAANNGGWQWTAGTGTDAAPYFRIFNPVLQSRRFDPSGKYIRAWVPELAALRDDEIHAPWEKGLVVSGYPPRPRVEHAEAVARARQAYQASRLAYSK